ncbi:MAG: isoprenyl transferase [Alphaproteobacteria bacterium]
MEALSSQPGASGVPVHVAIIMDGNGRWAKARGLPRTAGHKRGVEAARRTVRAAIELGISYLTIFGFSSENWNRPIAEVDDLMGLLRIYLRSEVAELHQNGVRLRFIGDRTRLSKDIVRMIEDTERRTGENARLNLTICLSYGGRAEIVMAARRIAERIAAGELRAEDLDDKRFEEHLMTAGIPDPDLIIRTSGEKRLSNFLLWQAAYAEFIFIDTLWPDFGKEHLQSAVDEFMRRERRYGATTG